MDLYSTRLENLKGVGASRAALLSKLGIDSVGALLEFYPRNYEDWASCCGCYDAPIGEACCVRARVATRVAEHRVRRGMMLYKFSVSDGIDKIAVTLFNNKYAAAKVQPGEELLLFGRVSVNEYTGRREMNSPTLEPSVSARIRPVYRQTEGLSSRMIEAAVRQALQLAGEGIVDPLPEGLRERFSLCERDYAIRQIHFPDDMQQMELARRRLVFEELFYLSLGLLMLRGRARSATAAVITRDYTDEFAARLPYELTAAQRRAVGEAVADMARAEPMNRLLQGDVGSGKTAVAAALCYTAVKNGFQCAMMAPTEILAEQHYRTLSKMLGGCSVALLTGSTPSAEKKRLLMLAADGGIDLLVGTHAIIQQQVQYRRLGLVITDEQHRFGVAQRAALVEKGKNPHVLVMSATPIPRTLALMMYGDLDISVLDELPRGRQPVESYLIDSSVRQRAFGYIKKHLDSGLQGYIVCPMVEQGEDGETAAAVEYYERLRTGEFSQYRLGLVHGRQKPAEKERVMRGFSSGEIQLLVSTTVIEVGVDVPSAAIMLIENAERFGLSQLHQLRGRIGRGSSRSTCILVCDKQNEQALARLRVLVSTTDGFKIADADLAQRGPGDFFGARQSGLPSLRIADIFADMEQLQLANNAAREIVREDSELRAAQHSGLQREVQRLFLRARGDI